MTERALLVDYGGVLTPPVAASFAAFEAQLGIDPGRSFALLVEASRVPGGGPIGALERGELTTSAFDEVLRGLLAGAGHVPPSGSLLEGLLRALAPSGRLWEVVARARDAGVVTVLVSNSWGTTMYPWDRIREHFVMTVISGEVGLRKPDPAIYHLTLDRLGLPASACAFVDDLERNVEVARSLGMFGVLHDGDEAATAAALSAFLGIDLALP